MMLTDYIGQRDALAPLIAAINVTRITGKSLPHTEGAAPRPEGLDGSFERRAWEQMADRLESAWWRIGSEENQDLYFALDEARSHVARLSRPSDERVEPTDGA